MIAAATKATLALAKKGKGYTSAKSAQGESDKIDADSSRHSVASLHHHEAEEFHAQQAAKGGSNAAAHDGAAEMHYEAAKAHIKAQDLKEGQTPTEGGHYPRKYK